MRHFTEEATIRRAAAAASRQLVLGGARATILKGMCERRVLSPDGAGFYSVPKPRSFTRNVTQLVTYTRLDKANVGVRWWSAGGAVIEVK